MKFRIKHIVVFALLFIAFESFSQQVALNTQFYHFDFIVNPSLSGKKDFNPIYLSYRNQWTGFNGSPETIQFGGSLAINSKNAIGVQFFQDIHGGAYKQSGLQFNYAKHFPININHEISFGTGLLLDQFSGDFSNLDLVNPNDDVYLIGQESKLLADLNFGVNYSYNNFNFGLSAFNLFQSKISNNSINLTNRLSRQYQLLSSYSFKIDSNVVLEPKVLVRALESGIYHGDLILLSKINDLYILGVSHRLNTAWSFIAGLDFNGALISYSYDFSSGLQNYTGSTHEIILGYKFKKGEIKRKVKDRDFDGIVDRKDLCPDEPGLIDNNGCPKRTINHTTEQTIQILDTISENDMVMQIDSNQLEAIDTIIIEIDSIVETLKDTVVKTIDEVEIDLIFGNIEFEFDKSFVKDQYFPDLLRIVEILKANPTWKLLIEGHTDAKRNVALAKRILKAKGKEYSIEAHDQMSKKYNKLLSQRRTDFVVAYFVKNGILKSRLKSIGHGEEQPITTNETELGRQKNRRVEVTIIK